MWQESVVLIIVACAFGWLLRQYFLPRALLYRVSRYLRQWAEAKPGTPLGALSAALGKRLNAPPPDGCGGCNACPARRGK